MLADKDRIFKNLYGQDDWGLEGARARGAWDGTKAILAKGREGIVNEMQGVRAARPRRRRLPDRPEMVVHAEGDGGRPHYLVINADESEPGTCKDREVMRNDPHLLVEGCLIAGCAMGAHTMLHLRPRRIHPRARTARSRRPAGL